MTDREARNKRLESPRFWNNAERHLADIRSLLNDEQRLREWLNDALTVLAAPAASSNKAKRELAAKMRDALALTEEVSR